MELISALDSKAPDKAAAVLKKGGLIIYPTDTIYGLGADASNEAAIRKIFEIKKRGSRKPVHIVVADIVGAERFVELTPLARALAKRFLPGALTLVLKAKDEVPRALTAGQGTLGIRIPDNRFCIETARALGGGITSTSANVSGQATGRNIEEIFSLFPKGFEGIDLVVDGGELPPSLPSSVVDARGAAPIILREGAIPVAEILGASAT